ncbi:hypothetical protein NL676_001178 [Syzygium grande]|nr:hypothetical protein NL676_001178 [Syzygium grande]
MTRFAIVIWANEPRTNMQEEYLYYRHVSTGTESIIQVAEGRAAHAKARSQAQHEQMWFVNQKLPMQLVIFGNSCEDVQQYHNNCKYESPDHDRQYHHDLPLGHSLHCHGHLLCSYIKQSDCSPTSEGQL